MPRRSRIMLAGVPVHVVQRGNNRGACFASDRDRSFYRFHLARHLARCGCLLHAYCLMTNHVHLLLTPKRPESCALLMKQVGQLHSQYFNRTYGRTGCLWEGRFRSCLVQSEGYLLACYRYIELNPVRAGMVESPAEYPWSSYAENALERPATEITTPHPEYLKLGSAAEERRREYARLFGSLGSDRIDEIRAATHSGYALGDRGFRTAMAQALGRRVDKGRPGRPTRSSSTPAAQLSLPSDENVVCP